MGYIFNKTNFIVIMVMIFLITMSMNEVLKYAQSVNLTNQAAYAHWFTSHKTVFATQEECEKTTAAICDYEECNYVPVGQTLQQVCGSDLTKGWRPTVVPIPAAYQHITTLTLSIGPAKEKQLVIIDPNALTVRYAPAGKDPTTAQAKPIKDHDYTLLLNNLVSYEFLGTAQAFAAKQPVDPLLSSYSIALTSEATTTEGSTANTYTVSCLPADCPRTILDLKSDIADLWGEPITEPAN